MKKNPLFPSTQLLLEFQKQTGRVLIEIEMKLQLGLKTFDQDKWHIGLNLFNKLLDHVDKSNINEDTDILEHIVRMIEDKM